MVRTPVPFVEEEENDMTFWLDLLFRSPKNKKDQIPCSPIAHIYIKYSGDEDGYKVISSRCMSLKEIEEQIDSLKRELEVIRKKAKQHFAKVHK